MPACLCVRVGRGCPWSRSLIVRSGLCVISDGLALFEGGGRWSLCTKKRQKYRNRSHTYRGNGCPFALAIAWHSWLPLFLSLLFLPQPHRRHRQCTELCQISGRPNAPDGRRLQHCVCRAAVVPLVVPHAGRDPTNYYETYFCPSKYPNSCKNRVPDIR